MGDFSLIKTGLKTSMWIFKVHEKENQLNSNFSWILSWIVISLTSSR